MAYALVVSAGIGLVSAGISAYSAGRSADNALNSQERMANQGLAFQQDQWNWQKARTEKEDHMRDAANAPLWNIINTPGVTDWGNIQSKTKGFFQGAQTATDEGLNRQGVADGSGLKAATTQANKLEEAKTLSQQWDRGLIAKTDVAAKLGASFNPNGAASLVHAPNTDALVGMYGQRAGMAVGAANGFGQAAGNAAYSFMNGNPYGANLVNRINPGPQPYAPAPTTGWVEPPLKTW